MARKYEKNEVSAFNEQFKGHVKTLLLQSSKTDKEKHKNVIK